MATTTAIATREETYDSREETSRLSDMFQEAGQGSVLTDVQNMHTESPYDLP